MAKFGAAILHNNDELAAWYTSLNLMDAGEEGISFENILRMLDIIKLLMYEI